MKSVSLQKRPARYVKNRVKNQGFSLIEILISLIVLSIGLMGLAGLQIAALKGTNHAHYRTEASLLMMNLADRMRANIDGVGDGNYRQASTATTNCSNAPTPICSTTSCTAAQLATHDLYSIACGDNGMEALLPQSKLIVECVNDDCSATDIGSGQLLNKTHNITIEWKEAKDKQERQPNKLKTRSIQLSIVP